MFCGPLRRRSNWLDARAGRISRRSWLTSKIGRPSCSRSIETLRAPAPAPASPAKSLDPSLAGDALQRLTSALDAYDLSAASDALADLDTAGLGAWAADEYGGLRRSVDAYEYDEARAIAARLLARVSVQRGRG